ncbi:hypothetical protein WR25_07293 [Diploscapter pachys]|uniref:Sigma non-opioid intracellular receptor 1 n=1 Tax=Diploscapter pachys TaxID=2018661 RepID=A0A2A2JX28_9BILA|nr:hypothetical protein WR25_07293 [Diploscapter pachys]
MAFFISTIIRRFVVLYLLFMGVQYLLKWNFYTISPKEFRAAADKAKGLPNLDSIVGSLASDLRKNYGQGVSSVWIPVVLGAHDVKINLLYTSLTEYVALINAPYASTGRAGLLWLNSTCTVLTGSASRVEDVATRAVEKESFTVGKNFRHGMFESYNYMFAPETTLACYGRGLVPFSGILMSVGGITHGEPVSVLQLAYYYWGKTLAQTAERVTHVFEHYKKRATADL